jgi:hypothetical protein
MDTIRTILANIIDEKGTEYLQKSPYAVYQKLISEKARPEYARLVLITLLCNVSVKAGEMDEAELSKDLQNSCFLRKKAAEDFHDYVTGDDYYPPVMEDYDAEYALSKCCKELGLKLVHVSSSGDMSDFEPDDMRW